MAQGFCLDLTLRAFLIANLIRSTGIYAGLTLPRIALTEVLAAVALVLDSSTPAVALVVVGRTTM